MIPVYCPLCCDQPFEDQQALFFHLRGYRNNLFCPICSERFSSLEYLVNHLSRKCYGPLSPPEAKKSCLKNITVNNEITHPFIQDDTNDLQNIIPIRQSGKEPARTTLELTNGTTLNQDGEASIPATPEISYGLRKKLSKNVSLSLSPGPKTPEQSNQPQVSTIGMGSSSNAVFQKRTLNSSVNIEVRTPTKNEKTQKKSLSTPTKATAGSEDDESDLEQASSSSKPFVKPGPLRYKLEQKNSKVLSSEFLTPSTPAPKFTPEVGTTKRGRGRPRKYNNEAPLLNGPRKESKPKLALTDDVNKAKLKSVSSSKDPTYPLPISKKVPAKSEENSKCDIRVSEKQRVKPEDQENLVDSSSDYIDDSTHQEDDSTHQEDDSSHQEDDSSHQEDDSTHQEDDSTHQEDDYDSLPNESVNDTNQQISPKTNYTEVKKQELNVVENEKSERTTDISSVEHETELKAEEEEEEYTCSACNVRFTSIYEHIKEFHNGEEVVVEVPEEEIKEDLKAYKGEDQAKVTVEPKASSSGATHDDNEEENSILSPDVTSVLKTNGTYPTTKGEIKEGTGNFQKNLVKDTKEQSKMVSPKLVSQLKKSGKWVQSGGTKKDYYQFVQDHNKLKILHSEMKNNTAIHPELKISIKDLFEEPKINVIEITHKPHTPFFAHRLIDFNKPIPMYVVERLPPNDENILGGIASYVISGGKGRTYVPEDSNLIAVMKVILASDRCLTVENIVFKEKPACEYMIPILEDIPEPDIPLLKGAKMLKWKCNKCFTTTWKFPLSQDSHLCNACTICHKPFVSDMSLKKHMAMHKKNDRYCEECQTGFATRSIMLKHMQMHENHDFCANCKIFIPHDQKKDHWELHNKDPKEQFPCGVCQKVFSSLGEVKTHQDKVCARLVAKYNCSYCDKKFFTQTALSYHIKDHKNISVKYPCRFCHKTFFKEKEQCEKKAGKRKPSSYIQKVWHERIHRRDRPYLCSSCPKRFRTLMHQSSHAAHAHTVTEHRDVPMHMCPVCDKVFNNYALLTAHLVCHSTQEQVLT